MRAVVLTRNGGPEVLELQELPDPVPGANDLLVRVEAVGVNYRDVYERVGGGAYDVPPGTVVGVEGAGTVVSAGAGVEEFAVGDRVVWIAAQGSYAELVAGRRGQGGAGARRCVVGGCGGGAPAGADGPLPGL